MPLLHIIAALLIAACAAAACSSSTAAPTPAPAGPDGQVDVPGVVVEAAEEVVSCRPTENALAEVIELFRTEWWTLESTVLPELPDGAA